MAESFPPYLGLDNLDPAFFTDYPPVLHAFILSAVTLIVFDRAKDLGTEQTIAFRFKSPVVNGLRFFNFTVRPLKDLGRRGKGDLYLIK
jgi:hypothetical protein